MMAVNFTIEARNLYFNLLDLIKDLGKYSFVIVGFDDIVVRV